MINKREIMKKTYITPECEVVSLYLQKDLLGINSMPIDDEVVDDMQSKKFENFGKFDRYFGGARSPWMKDEE